MCGLSNWSFRFPLGSVLLCIMCCCAASDGAWGAEPVKAGINDMKAAYVFNFIRFTEWPKPSPDQEASGIVLDVLGDEGFYETLQTVAQHEVAKQIGLNVNACSTESCLKAASVIYFAESDLAYEPQLELLAGLPVLTVSDIPGFASHGGMIEIRYQDEKLTFVVNLQAVQRAGLYISAQLLQLGEIVGRDSE
ncbi:MAG TPA: YfiR family protein [Mariprofundaceae bacterium]|nr:YfiR family protein [Mariprofundaceae bacterium]